MSRPTATPTGGPTVSWSSELEHSWPRFLLPFVGVATPVLVVAAPSSALQWLTLALLALPLFAALGRGQLREVASAYALHVAAFGLFTAGRMQADEFGARVRFDYPIEFDRLIGGGTVPTVRLQHWLHTASAAGPAWWDQIAFTTYTVHFFVIWLVCFVLWEQSLPRLRHFCIANAVAYAIALPFHVAFPTAPPWLASQDGLLPPIAREFVWVGLDIAPSAISNSLSVSGNDVAAVPSLHMAVAWLILLANWRGGRAGRWAALGYVCLMLWSVVYGGEHYVLDAVAGIVLGSIAWTIAAHAPYPLFAWRTPAVNSPISRS